MKDKVFSFSGNLVYNYGDRKELEGSFLEQKKGQIIGYLQEKTARNTYMRAIKGLYDETTRKLLFIKLASGDFRPEIYIFRDINGEGWVSAYHINYNTFSVLAGVQNGTAQLAFFNDENQDAKEIKRIYNHLYDDSTSLSKEMAEDVRKYEWLFSFVEHLKGSAK